MTTLVGIPASNLADCWEDIKHLIDDACTRSNGKYLAVDILKYLLQGSMQLWGAVNEDKIDAIAVTEIVPYPQIKVCRILASTGENMKEWFDHIEGIENWSKAQGCRDMEIIHRPGWVKPLKGKGYKNSHVISNKALVSEAIN